MINSGKFVPKNVYRAPKEPTLTPKRKPKKHFKGSNSKYQSKPCGVWPSDIEGKSEVKREVKREVKDERTKRELLLSHQRY